MLLYLAMEQRRGRYTATNLARRLGGISVSGLAKAHRRIEARLRKDKRCARRWTGSKQSWPESPMRTVTPIPATRLPGLASGSGGAPVAYSAGTPSARLVCQTVIVQEQSPGRPVFLKMLLQSHRITCNALLTSIFGRYVASRPKECLNSGLIEAMFGPYEIQGHSFA